jgi:Ni/Co efflux regulator RcnB
MKKLSIRALTLALALAATGTSMAQDRHDGHHGDHRGAIASDHRAHQQRDFREDRRDRRAERRADRQEARHAARHEFRRFHKGERMPLEYRHRQYVVKDYRAHHLHAPRKGYQWVQNGSDYAMVAIATGLIFQVLTN